jgi:hypothetical protein
MQYPVYFEHLLCCPHGHLALPIEVSGTSRIDKGCNSSLFADSNAPRQPCLRVMPLNFVCSTIGKSQEETAQPRVLSGPGSIKRPWES